jgi:hypothetical protein
LSNMDFHVITGYGMSNSFLEGNANADKPGWGKLQGQLQKCATSILIYP